MAAKQKSKRFGIQYNLVKINFENPKIYPDPGGIPEKFKGVLFHWSGTSRLDEITNIIFINLSFKFEFDSKPLLDFELVNEFKIQNTSSSTTANPKNGNITAAFIMHIVEMSICHARGLLAYFTKGTYLDGLYIPAEPKVTEAASPAGKNK